ncbi:MAG: hypothetical protein AMK74_00490 [Nitrospira bacterium SM23_35]|nr:MAG: hypothetical protein AMK74_00490 [Nitrospira bacterium SM23_35]
MRIEKYSPNAKKARSRGGRSFLNRSSANHFPALFDTAPHYSVQYNLPLGILIREGQKTERLPIGFKKTLQKMLIIR